MFLQLSCSLSDWRRDLRHFEVIQGSGEVIFVPSSWHHQVWNLEDTISVNHNWINACNAAQVTSTLRSEAAKVEAELADIRPSCENDREFAETCEKLLKANHGMNRRDFAEFLLKIGAKRVKFLLTDNNDISFDGVKLGRNHAKLDLKCIRSLLEDLVLDEDLKAEFRFLSLEMEKMRI